MIGMMLDDDKATLCGRDFLKIWWFCIKKHASNEFPREDGESIVAICGTVKNAGVKYF